MIITIFTSGSNFLEYAKNNVDFGNKFELLLQESFPDDFEASNQGNIPLTPLQQMQLLCDTKSIEDEYFITFVAYDSEAIHGIAQLVKEDTQKLRLVNFCRNKNVSNNKGVGKAMLQIFEEFVKLNHHYLYGFGVDNNIVIPNLKNLNNNSNSNKTCKIYLSVDSNNKQLQNYYLSLGWTNTKVIDNRGTKLCLEFSKNLPIE